jgi:hypothetical protein
VSISLSPSASPSPGYQGYTRGDTVSLPINDTDLETQYSEADKTDVGLKNDSYIDQAAQNQYAIHQYKDWIGAWTSVDLEWEGHSSTAPSTAVVILEIYNKTSGLWEEIDRDNTTGAETDFTLSGNIANTTNYKDTGGFITCRIYQILTL